MAMSLVKEVRNGICFFKAREGLPTAEDADANLRNSFVNALRVQINALPALAPADAAPLNEVLKDSPYGVEGTAKILEALDAKLHQAHSPSGKKARKPAPQHTQLLKRCQHGDANMEMTTVTKENVDIPCLINKVDLKMGDKLIQYRAKAEPAKPEAHAKKKAKTIKT